MKVGRSTNDQKQQQPQTVRPQHSKTSIRKQNTSKASGRLSRVGATFDQLLAKYMKKAIPHNRPIKQTKSKGRSVRKKKATKPA
jgi:molecular chaperone DnaK (HSP70)